jgi:hypothetical protein
MRGSLAVCTVIGGLILVSSSVSAVDLPKRKAGLWEVTLQMAGGKMPPQTVKFCTDAATDEALFQLGTNTADQMCSRKDISRNGDVVTMDTECKMGESKMTSHAVMTFTGDTAYKTAIQSHMDPPMMGRSETSMTQDARWTGACPADMQPGDMMMPNGIKMNLKSKGP